MKKVRLKNSEIESFWFKGDKNPCNCGGNIFYEYLSKNNEIIGACSCCERDLYTFNYTEDEIKSMEWGTRKQ